MARASLLPLLALGLLCAGCRGQGDGGAPSDGAPQPPDPLSPPPTTANCTELWMDQPLDHFNYLPGQPTWQQRYFLCDQFLDASQPRPPVLFYGAPKALLHAQTRKPNDANFKPITRSAPCHLPPAAGNEGGITARVNNSGFLWQLASELGALLVWGEVRRRRNSAPSCHRRSLQLRRPRSTIFLPAVWPTRPHPFPPAAPLLRREPAGARGAHQRHAARLPVHPAGAHRLRAAGAGGCLGVAWRCGSQGITRLQPCHARPSASRPPLTSATQVVREDLDLSDSPVVAFGGSYGECPTDRSACWEDRRCLPPSLRVAAGRPQRTCCRPDAPPMCTRPSCDLQGAASRPGFGCDGLKSSTPPWPPARRCAASWWTGRAGTPPPSGRCESK